MSAPPLCCAASACNAHSAARLPSSGGRCAPYCDAPTGRRGSHVDAQGCEPAGAGADGPGGAGLAERAGGARRRRFGAAAGRREGPRRQRLRVLQPAGASGRRGPARGQGDHRQPGHRHGVRRPGPGGAGGGADRAGRVRRRGHVRVGAGAAHQAVRRGRRRRGGEVRQPGCDDGDGVHLRRAVPAGRAVEVPGGRAGVRLGPGRAGPRVRHLRRRRTRTRRRPRLPRLPRLPRPPHRAGRR